MSDRIEITRKRVIYTESTVVMRVRSRHGLVYWFIGEKPVEMTTTAAHDTGFGMVMQADQAEAGELVIVKINGVAVQFLPHNAKQVGGALLRKADDADDFQLRVNT